MVANINGHFRKFFENLQKKKDDFSLVLIVGNLFGDPKDVDQKQAADVQDLVNEKINVPITTYFMLGSHDLPQAVKKKLHQTRATGSSHVCENLVWLGRGTKVKPLGKSEPIRIATNLDDDFDNGPRRGRLGEADLNEPHSTPSPHILLTNEWPEGVRQGSRIVFKGSAQESDAITQLTKALKPRYHFTTSDKYYEREPYWYEATGETGELFLHTRFISLAAYDNHFSPKEKSTYGFTIDPMTIRPDSKPLQSTPSPWARPNKRESNYVAVRESRPVAKKHKPQATVDHSKCFFCLANDGIAMHLLTCLATHAYMTTAKGPLPTPGMFPELGFPGHMLLIPHEHIATLAAIQQDERHTIYEQLQGYRIAANKMIKDRAGEEYGSVTWETSKISLPHIHWQYLPIPVHYIRHGQVEAAFKLHAKNSHWAPKFHNKDIGDGSEVHSDYFRVLIWDPSKPENEYTSLVLEFNNETKFPAQTGREVLARLLELDNRADWHVCAQTVEEETKDAEAFKRAFASFDPYPE